MAGLKRTNTYYGNIKLLPGTLKSPVENGAFEYDGINYYLTNGGIRYKIQSSVKSVVVDIGNTAVNEKEFTISDVDVLITSKVMAFVGYDDTTDNSADEIEMSHISCSTGGVSAGSFKLLLIAGEGPISGKINIFYTIN